MIQGTRAMSIISTSGPGIAGGAGAGADTDADAPSRIGNPSLSRRSLPR